MFFFWSVFSKIDVSFEIIAHIFRHPNSTVTLRVRKLDYCINNGLRAFLNGDW